MVLEIDVCLQKKLLNSQWDKRFYKKAKVSLKRKFINRSCSWYLTDGANGKKFELKVTQNITKTWSSQLELSGVASIAFKEPNVLLQMKLCSPTGSQKLEFMSLLKTINKLMDGKDVKYLEKLPLPPDATFQKISLLLSIPITKFPLSSLDLSGRGLADLPAEVRELKLSSLNLENNQLGKGKKNWDWLNGPIEKFLCDLSLNNNQLTKVPLQLINFKNLQNLSLADNELRSLPPRLFFINLKKLFLANNSNLEELNSPMKPLWQLDVSNCHRLYDDKRQLLISMKPEIRLKNIAANALLAYRWLSYTNHIPRELADFLNGSWICGNCFTATVNPSTHYIFSMRPDVESLVSSSNDIYCKSAVCDKCSKKQKFVYF